MSISSSIISCSFLPFRFLLLFVESCTLTFILFCYNTVILPSVVVFVSVVVSRTSIMSFFWMALDYFLEPVVYLKQSLHFWGRGKVCIHCTLHTPHSTLHAPHTPLYGCCLSTTYPMKSPSEVWLLLLVYAFHFDNTVIYRQRELGIHIFMFSFILIYIG